MVAKVLMRQSIELCSKRDEKRREKALTNKQTNKEKILHV